MVRCSCLWHAKTLPAINNSEITFQSTNGQVKRGHHVMLLLHILWQSVPQYWVLFGSASEYSCANSILSVTHLLHTTHRSTQRCWWHFRHSGPKSQYWNCLEVEANHTPFFSIIFISVVPATISTSSPHHPSSVFLTSSRLGLQVSTTVMTLRIYWWNRGIIWLECFHRSGHSCI